VSGVPWWIITGSGLDDWIYWHFYYNYNQLSQFTINDCLRRAPFHTGLWVSSLPNVTDLDLIYELVTSSASIVCWLTLHSWTLNSLTNDECQTTAHSSLSWMNWTNSFITLRWTEYKVTMSYSSSVILLFCVYSLPWECAYQTVCSQNALLWLTVT
jgi:hypothetical protein